MVLLPSLILLINLTSGPPPGGRFVHWWTQPKITNQLSLNEVQVKSLAKKLNDHQIRYHILLTKIRQTRFQLQKLYRDPAISSAEITRLYDTNLAPHLADMDRLRMQARIDGRDELGDKGLAEAGKKFPHLFTSIWFTKPTMPVMEVQVKK